MAHSRLQLRDAIRQRMGWSATDTFVTDSELNGYILDSARELHSLLVGLWPAGQFGNLATTITTTVGTSAYPLPADFGRLVSIRMTVSNAWVPVEPLDPTVDLIILDTRSWDYARVKYWIQKQSDFATIVTFYPPPAAVYSVIVFYIKGAPDFAGGDGDTSWMGEDEYIILDCCLKCCAKQEQDPAQFATAKERYQQRLEQQATPLDMGRGPTIQDLKSSSSREDAWWFRR